MLKQKAIVVTGVDSGIGRVVVDVLLQRGWYVIGSYLNNNLQINNDSFTGMKMDITNSSERYEFVKFCQLNIGEKDIQLQAVVNNSGIAFGGPVEDLSLELYRNVFEVNFFGLVELTKLFIPLLRLAKGRFVMIGSLAGKIASPFLSPYAASKFAVEGFCDSLRRELLPQGIGVTLVEPAAISTPIWSNAEKQDMSFLSKRYKDVCMRFMSKFISEGKAGMATDLCAQKICDFIERKKIKNRLLISTTPILHRVLPLLPDWLLDTLIIKEFNIFYGDEK